MLRKIGGVVAGLVAAFATIFLVQMVGHTLFPVSGQPDLSDPVATRAFMASLSAGALAFVALAWLLGATAGASVAARLSGERWAAWVIAGVIALSSIANVAMFPHPLWMQIAGVAAPLIGGWIGARFARPRTDEDHVGASGSGVADGPA